MNVLLDHCVPRGFARLLTPHTVHTVAAMGWEARRNGELLAGAAAEFGAFVTVDRNLRFQQDVGELPLAVVTLVAVSNRMEDLAPLAPRVLSLLGAGVQRRAYRIGP